MSAEYDGIILGTGHNSLVLHGVPRALRPARPEPGPGPRSPGEGWPRWRTRASPASGTIPIRSSTGPSR